MSSWSSCRNCWLPWNHSPILNNPSRPPSNITSPALPSGKLFISRSSIVISPELDTVKLLCAEVELNWTQRCAAWLSNSYSRYGWVVPLLLTLSDLNEAANLSSRSKSSVFAWRIAFSKTMLNGKKGVCKIALHGNVSTRTIILSSVHTSWCISWSVKGLYTHWQVSCTARVSPTYCAQQWHIYP